MSSTGDTAPRWKGWAGILDVMATHSLLGRKGMRHDDEGGPRNTAAMQPEGWPEGSGRTIAAQRTTLQTTTLPPDSSLSNDRPPRPPHVILRTSAGNDSALLLALSHLDRQPHRGRRPCALHVVRASMVRRIQRHVPTRITP